MLPKRDGRWRLELGLEQEGLSVGPGVVGSRCSEFPSLGSGDFGMGLAGRLQQDNLGVQRGARAAPAPAEPAGSFGFQRHHLE